MVITSLFCTEVILLLTERNKWPLVGTSQTDFHKFPIALKLYPDCDVMFTMISFQCPRLWHTAVIYISLTVHPFSERSLQTVSQLSDFWLCTYRNKSSIMR